MKRALIVGYGIASMACAKLLAHHGWNIMLWQGEPRPLPTIVLNNVTCRLLWDIWGKDINLFKEGYALYQRKMRWGQAESLNTLEQAGIVLKTEVLLETLYRDLMRTHVHQISVEQNDILLTAEGYRTFFRQYVHDFDWIVDASGRSTQVAQHCARVRHNAYGQRLAISSQVQLTATYQPSTSWIETLQDGWIFLAPMNQGKALLQAMVPTLLAQPVEVLETLLTQTTYLKTQVEQIISSIVTFQAFPQITSPLCGNGWITVGDAAMALDPLSGDGTGSALRGAILATSILNSISHHLPENDGLCHYRLRLYPAFLTHLKACIAYYNAAFKTSDWRREIDIMSGALKQEMFSSINEVYPSHRLQDFQLVPLVSEASELRKEEGPALRSLVGYAYRKRPSDEE